MPEQTTTSAEPLALLTGGKSAGHVFPALAVGDELRRRGWRLAYAGQAESMEERLATVRGIEFHRVSARPLVGRGWLERIRALVTTLLSGLSARSLVRRLGASVVVATGGFVSAPAVIGAWLARRAVVLLEPNAEPGAANRLLSRFADLAALGHAAAARGLRCASVVTGVPVRAEFARVAALSAAGGPMRLLVLGGSQGAARLNEALPRALAETKLPAGLEVVHQAGAANVDAAAAAYAEHFEESGENRFARDGVSVEVVPFVDDVASALASCDLVVSRAGAITLAELCAAGRGAILMPLRLAGGHQQANARALASAGAAVAIEEDEPARLASTLSELLSAPERLRAMGAAARELGAPSAAADIADLLEKLVGRSAA